ELLDVGHGETQPQHDPSPHQVVHLGTDLLDAQCNDIRVGLPTPQLRRRSGVPRQARRLTQHSRRGNPAGAGSAHRRHPRRLGPGSRRSSVTVNIRATADPANSAGTPSTTAQARASVVNWITAHCTPTITAPTASARARVAPMRVTSWVWRATR